MGVKQNKLKALKLLYFLTLPHIGVAQYVSHSQQELDDSHYTYRSGTLLCLSPGVRCSERPARWRAVPVLCVSVHTLADNVYRDSIVGAGRREACICADDLLIS